MKELFIYGVAAMFLFLPGCDLFTLRSPDFYNLNFEESIGDTDIPYGWEYDNYGGFTIGQVDNQQQGGKCLRIYCEKPEMKKFNNADSSLASASFVLKLRTDLVKGKYLEVKARAKTKAVFKNARLILRVLGKDTVLQEVNDPRSVLRGNKEWEKLTIGADVSEEAETVYIGGMMEDRGTAWFDDFEIYIDGKRLKDGSLPSEPTSAELEWLRAHVHPIRSVDPGSSAGDLDPLIRQIGDASVLAIGGSTFGSSENFRMRHRIMEALTEENRNITLIFSGSMPLTNYLSSNRLLMNEGWNNPMWISGLNFLERKDFDYFLDWTKNLHEENPSLLIGGFEDYAFAVAYEEIVKVCATDPVLANKAKSLGQELGLFWRAKYPMDKKEKQPKEETERIERMRVLLHAISEQVEKSHMEPEQKERIACNVPFILKTIGQEDHLNNSYRMDNLLWSQHYNPGSQLVWWSLNQDIKRTGNSLGNLLTTQFGEEYISVGFAFYEGTYYALGFQGAYSYKAIQAYPGTYEYYFHQLGEPCFMLDLRKVRDDRSKEGEWLRQPALFRNVGVKKTTTEFSPASLASDYDILIFIDRSTATKHGRY